ncbi:Deoxynucleotidyltransferase terminal-interacting protein 2 [Tritrichomonas musculus]|uniref:Deoxynucleotidyltransferase terminal-interacting protein 2 n=1 Tax=Tritrichomonas musculus TaxID=1915356 RepID=A0ABR2K7Z4_9EUKA
MNWDTLIAQAKKENISKKDQYADEELNTKESSRDFEFADALEDSIKKKVESSMEKAELDPFKIKPKTKVEKLETAGANWFNMPKAEITEEIKRDWELLRMRSVLKSGGVNGVQLPENPPEFLQVGVIKDNPIEGPKGRVGRRYRGATITEALVKDADFRDFLERKYQKLEKKKSKY